MDPLAAIFVNEKISQDYAAYRTHYSDELYKVMVDHCRETSQHLNLAVDVGCGPGNSTLGFCKYFKKVIGVDISPTQIECAPKDIPNCEFRVGSSDKLGFLEKESVDLFASALAFFLMPQKDLLNSVQNISVKHRTFAEADRVLRPGGTIAIFGHGPPTCSDPTMKEILKEDFTLLHPHNSPS